MKRFLIAAFITSAGFIPSFASANGVIGQPNYYGRIDFDNSLQPEVIYNRPTVIGHAKDKRPVYLRVPKDQEKHWAKHCAEYNACNRRVLFVNNKWYRNVYIPHYQQQQQQHQDNRYGDKNDNYGHNKDSNDNSNGNSNNNYGHNKDNNVNSNDNYDHNKDNNGYNNDNHSYNKDNNDYNNNNNGNNNH